MSKNVIISIKGTQTNIDSSEEANILELVTEGKYLKKGNAYYITYKESEVTGMNGTTTTLKVKDDTITLMRFGSINSQFIFQQGHKHICHYETSHGAFTIAILANEVSINVDDNGGEICVGYQMEVNYNKAGFNDFCMQIREAGQFNDKCNRQ